MGWQNTLQSIRQLSLPPTRALREELDTVKAQHAAVCTELDTVRAEFVQAHECDTQQIHALQSQLNQIESDRNSARQEAQLLGESLQQANHRQASTEQRIASLETQLEEARHQYASNLALARDALARLQSEQQGVLSLQRELAHTIHDVSNNLLQTQQARTPPRMSMLQLSAIASLLFLSGALATALVFRDSLDTRLDISGLNKRTEELHLLMKAHARSHDQLLALLTQLVEQNSLSRPVPDQGAVPSAEDADLATTTPPPVEVDESDSQTAPHINTRIDGAFDMRSANLQALGLSVSEHPDDPDADEDEDIAKSLRRFRQLYWLEEEPDAVVDAALQRHADAARADAQKYNIDGTILAAIRLASLHTGVKFSYLMELAEVESGFNPQARAKTSTASGLYQFKDTSWLDAVRAYGDSYGLACYASQVDDRLDDNGLPQPFIEDSAVQQRVLDLRFDPHLSALLAAENVRSGRERLVNTLERQPDRAELYLTHFFGTSGAISFLKALAKSPDRIAGEIFPGPAKRNRSIFQTGSRTPRTLAEVFRVLGRKFNTARYEDS